MPIKIIQLSQVRSEVHDKLILLPYVKDVYLAIFVASRELIRIVRAECDSLDVLASYTPLITRLVWLIGPIVPQTNGRVTGSTNENVGIGMTP